MAKRHLPSGRSPLPEVIGALEAHQVVVGTSERQTSVATLSGGRRSEVESDLQESHLNDNHQQGLEEKTRIVLSVGPVKYSIFGEAGQSQATTIALGMEKQTSGETPQA